MNYNATNSGYRNSSRFKDFIIPYKNWFTQTKYGIENWPDDVIFQDFSNIKNEEDRKKLSIISFKKHEVCKIGLIIINTIKFQFY